MWCVCDGCLCVVCVVCARARAPVNKGTPPLSLSSSREPLFGARRSVSFPTCLPGWEGTLEERTATGSGHGRLTYQLGTGNTGEKRTFANKGKFTVMAILNNLT